MNQEGDWGPGPDSLRLAPVAIARRKDHQPPRKASSSERHLSSHLSPNWSLVNVEETSWGPWSLITDPMSSCNMLRYSANLPELRGFHHRASLWSRTLSSFSTLSQPGLPRVPRPGKLCDIDIEPTHNGLTSSKSAELFHLANNAKPRAFLLKSCHTPA